MSIELFPHQSEFVQSALRAYVDGEQEILGVLPTGAGKTIAATHLASILCPEGSGKRVLWLIDTKELAYQALSDFRIHYDSAHLGLVQAENDDVTRQCVVAVVDTLENSRRRERLLSYGKFHLIIVDEAHTSIAPKYKEVIRNCMHPDGLVVGITATPERSDGQSLGQLYTMIYAIGMLDLMSTINPRTNYPYLADIKSIRVKTKVNLDRLAEREGEFNVDEVWKEATKDRYRHHQAVAAWRQWGENSQTLLFAINIADAEEFVRIFNEEGIPAIGVYGHTHPKERERIMGNKALKIPGAFEKGEYKVLVNVGVATKGVDFPFVRCVLVARMCRFAGLYKQIIGRGSRICLSHPLLSEPKTSFIVIDMADNNHHVYTVNKLVGSMEEKIASVRRSATKQKEEKISDEPFWEKASQAMSSYRLRGLHGDMYSHLDEAGQWHYNNKTQRIQLSTEFGMYELHPEGGHEATRAYRLTQKQTHELTRNGPTDLRFARGLVLQDYYQRKQQAKEREERQQSDQPVSEKTLEFARKRKLYMIQPHMTEGSAQQILQKFFDNPTHFHSQYYARMKQRNRAS